MLVAPMHDNRLNTAWEAWRQEQMALEPDKPTIEYTPSFKPFVAGWHARINAALKSWNASDEQMIRDEFERFEQGHHAMFEHIVTRVSDEKKLRRDVEALRGAMRTMGGDPDDSPLYRRITNQRNEIKRLQAVIDALSASSRDE